MAKAVSRTLYLDTLSAQREVELLTTRINRLDKKIQEGQASGKKMTKELADMEKAKAALNTVQNQIDKGLKPSLKQLEDFARRTNNELKRMSQSDPEFQKKIALYQQAQFEISQIKREINGVEKAQESWASKFKSFGTGFLTGIVASFGAETITNFISQSVEEFKQAELASARFEAKLRNLGRVDVFQRLTQYAEEMAQQFRFLDNDDIINVFSKLIDYGKLTETQIRQLTPVIIDFAANSRISLEDAASVVIKALEGNGKALKEYGIDIKDAKDETEAFGIIMDQLKPKVDGAADAFQNTLAGSAAIATQEIANLKEEIGKNWEEPTRNFYGFIAKLGQGITGFMNYFKTFKIFFDENVKIKNLKYDPSVGFYEDAPNSSQQSPAPYNTSLEQQLFANYQNNSANATSNQNTVVGAGGKNQNKNKQNSKATPRTKIEDNPRFKLLRELKQLEEEVAMLGKSNDQKELERIINKYNKLIEEARNYTDIVIQFEKLRNKEVAFWIDEIEKKRKADLLKQEQEEKKQTEKLLNEYIKRQTTMLANVATRNKKELFDQAKLKIATATTDKELYDAKLGMLKLEREATLANENLTQTERLLIIQDYQKQEEELTAGFLENQKQKILAKINLSLQAFGQMVSVIESINQIQSQKEQQELQKDIKRNDKKRQSYKRLLDQRVITEQEYRLRIAQLDEQEDKKRAALQKKQFLRNQKTQIAQAVINGAMAVTNILATVPKVDFGILTNIMIAMAAATTAAQIAVIATQKPPEYAKGGLLRTGKRHSEGGMPVLDPNTGQKVAEVEQGEAILSRATVANNPELVDALLQSSMYQGGRRIRFFERPLRPINYARINAAVTRSFENGGIMAAAAPQQDLSLQNEIKQSLLLLAAATQQLTAQLQQPITATITQKKIDEAAALRNRILSDASFKP